jgi:hypothetical protein
MKIEGDIMPIDPNMNYKQNVKVITIRIKSDEVDDDDAMQFVKEIFELLTDSLSSLSFEYEVGEL